MVAEAPILAAAALAMAVSACAIGGLGSGPVRSADGLGWGRLDLGLSLAEAEARAGRPIDVRAIEDPCAEAGARLVVGGEELFLGFESSEPSSTLRSIVRRLPDEEGREQTIRELRRRLPGLRYRPDPRWPDMPEEEHPAPLYLHPDAPDQAVRLSFEDGWMTIAYLACLERPARRALVPSRSTATRRGSA